MEHADVLQPHLKGFDSADMEAELFVQIAYVLMKVVPVMQSPRKNFLDHIVTDLVFVFPLF